MQRILLIVLLLVVWIEAKKGEKVEFRTTKIHVRYEKGTNCHKKRQRKEACETFVSGSGEFPVLRGDSCRYDFMTVDNKNSDPVRIEGVIGSIYMENVTSTKLHFT